MNTKPKTETFTVDAALLAELGERLIGRAPIALAELVKNSYDADASTCTIRFGKDSIIVSDDGSGISEREFLDYWMRIGTTHQIDEGRSAGGRPLTGSKGIGRLSVQFLAAEMKLESTSKATPARTLHAKVDWSQVVRGADLNEVKVKWWIEDSPIELPGGSTTGTRITMRGLRTEWDAEELEKLGEEVWLLRSPFRRSSEVSTPVGPEHFYIEVDAPEIEEAREAFDRRWHALFNNWKARIRGSLQRGRYGGDARVEVEFEKGYPERANDGAVFRETVNVPLETEGQKKREALIDEVEFEILVFRTTGKQSSGIAVADLRKYLADYGNVSVYDAGFRLPYYGSGKGAGQDWLSIALDQGRRINQSQLLPESLRGPAKYMQDLPAPGRIFGSVEINTNHERRVARKAGAEPGEWLQIQPGRDRLHDNAAFGQLRDLVRFSLDYYASLHRLRVDRAREASRPKEPPSKKYDRAIEVLRRHEAEIPQPVFLEVRRGLSDARQASSAEEKALEARAALLAPLATAGMTALALRHELAREIRFLDVTVRKLKSLASNHGLPELYSIAEEFAAAKSRLSSLTRLFAPLISQEDKEATNRLRVRAVVDEAIAGMKALTPRVEYDARDIPDDLRFPLGSFAEWNALLHNALSNAWNAMLDADRSVVRISGGREKSGREWLRISDSGEGLGVELDEADQLFEPFERRLEVSRDNRSLLIGGQGIGLAIVRMIASRRGAGCRFVEPEDDFSTTLEVYWSGGKR